MKQLALLLLTVSFVSACPSFAAEGEVSLHLQLEVPPTIIVSEPMPMTLHLLNDGPAVQISRSLSKTTILLERDGEWLECSSGVQGLSGSRAPLWETVPEDGLELQVPFMGKCFCKGPSSDCLEWRDMEGSYRLKVRWTHDERWASLESGPGQTEILMGDGRRLKITPEVKKRVFSGSLESDVVQITVLSPVGQDAQAVAWSKEHGLGVLSVETALRFPSSRYAAHTLRSFFWGRWSGTEPLALVDAMKRGKYLTAGGLPVLEGETVREETMTGPELARWRRQHIETFLAAHPDHWLADEYRLILALDSYALGEEEIAIDALEELSSSSSRRVAKDSREYSRLLSSAGAGVSERAPNLGQE